MSCRSPAPYLTSYFYPGRPQLPSKAPPRLADQLREAAVEIQSERYREAARRLVDLRADDLQLMVPAAECLLHADEPAEAQALLSRHLPPDGNWALACALVQQHDLDAALQPLASLARFGLLRDERRVAAALLVEQLGGRARCDELSDLAASPDELALARATGYRMFVDRAVSEIESANDPPAVSRIVEWVEARCSCESTPEREAWAVLVPVYEAAVRATSDRDLASRALDRVLSWPTLLGGDDTAYSRALLFATVADRLPELADVLRTPIDATEDARVRHARWLAAAKLSLVQNDVDGVEADSARAVEATYTTAGPERANWLHRAGLWLRPDDAPRFSQWALRPLHPYLPAAAAERLEDRDGRFLADVERRASRSDAGRRAVLTASARLHDALTTARTSNDRELLRKPIGQWAHHIAIAMLEAGWGRPVEPAAYADAARRLLGPAPPADVMATLARALGYAYSHTSDREQVRDRLDIVVSPRVDGTAAASAFMQQVLAEWEQWRRSDRASPVELVEDVSACLQPASTERGRPRPLVSGLLSDLNAPDPVPELIKACFEDLEALLPDAAPFRGRRWFAWEEAHRLYQSGRAAKDPLDSFRDFEAAWMREPNGIATTQGLIHGLRGRVREQRGRMHALERRARILDQRVDREVEAALAWRTLAGLADRESPEWRAHLERAAAALGRGAYRRPWTRARNAEIAVLLELGDVTAAGAAAWDEARLWLPGTGTSRRYAQLAESLLSYSRSANQPDDARIREARELSRRPPLTNRESVRYVMGTAWLDALATVELDEGSLEMLWQSCRGDEDKLRRSLLRWDRDEVDEPAYIRFLRAKLSPEYLPATTTRRMAELRLASAELLAHDTLNELARPPAYLYHVTVRRFLAALRSAARDDPAAYERFSTKVEDALSALFELRHAIPVSQVEPYGGRLARARAAIYDVAQSALSFAHPDIARCTEVVGRHLETGLDEPTISDYVREKRMRLVPSRLGLRLGEWYAALRRVSGSQDFFHQHQHYRYFGDQEPQDWLEYHFVQGIPAGQAIRGLLESLELHSRHLAEIQADYRGSRREPEAGLYDFGLANALHKGVDVLRRALSPMPTRDDLGAIASTLRVLGDTLRGLDMARPARADGVLLQHGLPDGQYLVPLGVDLLSHWRNNVGDHPTFRAIFEMKDDGNRDVFCALSLDEEPTPAPEVVTLRGLAPHADVVEALGGQLHLWMARPGRRSGCRRDHRECTAGDYVVRIERRLRELSANQWYSEQATVEKWLKTLQQAPHGQQSATLSFIVLPRLRESGA